MNDVRVGLVGLGQAARNIHLPAFARLGIEPVAVCDVEATAVEAVARKATRARGYTDLGEMISQQALDLLVVATPPAHHAAPVTAALRGGVDVFCEKPLCESAAEAEGLVALARECGRSLSVNHEFRYMNVHHKARAEIGGERFGRLRFVELRQCFVQTEATEEGWRGELDRRVGLEFGIHAVDLCRYFYGDEPVSVQCVSAGTPPEADRGDPGPEALQMIWLEFPGGRLATITLNRLTRGSHRYLDSRLDGSKATLRASIGGQAEVRLGLDAAKRRPFGRLQLAGGAIAHWERDGAVKHLASDPMGLFAHATAALLEQVLLARERGVEPPCPASDHLLNLHVIEACYRSAASGARVRLEGPEWERRRG